MQVAIVHLSDIHFSGVRDPIVSRLEKLSNLINSSRSAGEHIVLAITGDIAFSGSREEYETALTFLRQMLIVLGLTGEHVVVIPGNHDCNFRNAGDLRPMLLENVHQQFPSLDLQGQTVGAILTVQDDFFSFVEKLTGEAIPPQQRLFYVRSVVLNGTKLEFRCFNSAWLSSKNEEQGSLGFPESVLVPAAVPGEADLVLSLVHHPYNWLDATNAHAFKKAIQHSSDFLLTGHEHTVGGHQVSAFDGSRMSQLESGPLQSGPGFQSEFAILHLDFASRTWRREAFKWSEGLFVKTENSDPYLLERNPSRKACLQITPAFESHLQDPGTGFLHPRKQNLTLDDIYIYPDFQLRGISHRLHTATDLPKYIHSSEAPDQLLSADHLIIAGPQDCGKSALAKMLFVHACDRQGKAALLLNGCDIRASQPGPALQRSLKKAINEIYGARSEDGYRQLSREDKILFIDDWDDVPFNKAGRSAILKEATAQFGKVVLFVNDLFLLEELSHCDNTNPVRQFQAVDLKEFGFRLRGQLIRKWHRIGTLYTEDEQTFAQAVADSTRMVDTVINRNLLPPYPVNVLTLLQTYDATAGAQSNGIGSYGQVYEALLTARLAKVSLKSIDIGTKITYLSRVAFFMFDKGKRGVSEAEWNLINDQYCAEYRIRLESRSVVEALIAAGILMEESGCYRFIYGYTFCYFVAKYFQDNLADLDDKQQRDAVLARLRQVCDRVYSQDNANIIIFYIFLTKDRSFINHIIERSTRILNKCHEFDFDKDIEFLNRTMEEVKSLILPSTTPEQNQEEYNKRRDERREVIEPEGDASLAEIEYSDTLPFEQQVIFAVRYIGLMGQILRNFPGSLKGDPKLELASETYSLGLRFLTATFKFAEDGAEQLVREIMDVLRERMAFSGTDRELEKRASLILKDLLRECAFAVLKRVSHSVGLRELEETYREVSALRDHNLSSRMIDLSIKLDHFTVFPRPEIEELISDLGKNVFAFSVLRDLVANYLYLFPAEYSARQWAGQTLMISVSDPKVVGSARKLLPANGGKNE